MEHLDLAGVITSSNNWNLPLFDQQDAVYLSNSRQMLEPILEETSDDEERAQNSWNQYETSTSFWSSAESETGSVIRVELSKDTDSISERDFVCPAKRARRSDEFLIGGPTNNAVQQQQQQHQSSGYVPLLANSLDDSVLLRRSQRYFDPNDMSCSSLERFLAYEASARDSFGAVSSSGCGGGNVGSGPQRHSTGSTRRFDEFFSDSDSMSYNSLSRSSSLVQFESLERQLLLQEQHASMTSLGNSSPSLLSSAAGSTEDTSRSGGGGSGGGGGSNSGSNSGNNSRRGSQSSLLKRFESSDGRLHQTYYDLDKLNFDDDEKSDKRTGSWIGSSTALGGGVGGCKSSSSFNAQLEIAMGEVVKSDSESSTSSSSSSSGNSILTASKPSVEDLTDSSGPTSFSGSANGGGGSRATRIIAFQHQHQRSGGKNSAENLSEDSGYCEPSTLRRAKSKSIPKNFEKFCEEEEEYEFPECGKKGDFADDVDEMKGIVNSSVGVGVGCGVGVGVGISISQNTHSKVNSSDDDEGEQEGDEADLSLDICQPKINDATFIVKSNTLGEIKLAPGTEMLATEESTTKTKTTPSSSPPPPLPQVTSCPWCCSNDCVKNSCPTITTKTTMATTTATTATTSMRESLLEHRRSLAHSPSPVSSIASSESSTRSSASSASTCASEASFTWMPIPIQQHQHQQQQPRQYLDDDDDDFVCPINRRNSLPDVRDAFSSDPSYSPSFSAYNRKPFSSDFNGYGLEHSREERTASAADEVAEVEAKAAPTAAKIVGAIAADVDDNDNNNDDSDISSKSSVSSSSSSSSSSSHKHTDEDDDDQNDNEDGSSGCGVGGGRSIESHSGGYGNRAGISSVPDELDKLGRNNKKRSTAKYRYSKSSTDDDDEDGERTSSSGGSERRDFFDDSSLKIRRSCSWSERRERKELRRQKTQSLGYMNASYQDLTKLDYSAEDPQGQQSKQVDNLKRGVNVMQRETTSTTTRKSRDYEELICKGNFLLDELSEIYDKNASILNDQTVKIGSVRLEPINGNGSGSGSGSGSSPRPPPRQRKHSSSSHSDVEPNGGGGEVQHVQLTIRKAPARQKRSDGRKLDPQATNSLIGADEVRGPLPQLEFSSFGKTFDQDPTNLRTSYAQSLEKCNFDAKELSSAAVDLSKPGRVMPKRRFQSQASTAKKRNLVSSTPNLNEYNRAGDDDELEDDIYVSSAHTSMHQLPQSAQPKPLGILLPAGSRTSFGKEVSFCPVVSKYSWQEQSSEECNEPTATMTDGQDDGGVDGHHHQQQEDTDDELLDNADATVIYNTKENEMIAARYRAANEEKADEKESQLRERQQPVEKVRAVLVREVKNIAQESGSSDGSDARPVSEMLNTSHKSDNNDDGQQRRPPQTKLVSKANGDEDAATAQREATTNVSSETKTNVETTFGVGDGISEIKSEINRQQITTTITTPSAVNIESVTKVGDSSESNKNNSNNSKNKNNNNNKNNAEQSARPLSIQLPILSEPPINRAHHILYASQHMLDTFQRRERDREEQERLQLQQQQQQQQQPSGVDSLKKAKTLDPKKMSRYSENDATIAASGSGKSSTMNNNNDLLPSKFKADEKHPNSKSFLSRFANGFRFSLRGKKKKQLKEQQHLQQEQTRQHDHQQEQKQQKAVKDGILTKTFNGGGPAAKSSSSSSKSKTPDFLFIPLKGPRSSSPAVGEIGGQTSKASNGRENKVTGKPPLPHRTSSQGQAAQQRGSGPAQNINGNGAMATNFVPGGRVTSNSKFYTDTDFLNSERSFYDYDEFENQLKAGMQANGYALTVAGNGGVVSDAAGTVDYAESSPSRGSVSQKTQMFNNFQQQQQQQQQQPPQQQPLLHGNGVSSVNRQQLHQQQHQQHQQQPQQKSHHTTQPRIGLIETNLDTHETVISGKTRSLMDIGPLHRHQQQQQQQQQRLHAMTIGGGGNCDIIYDGDDDDSDLTSANNDGSASRIKTSSQGGGSGSGSQIASVRRPHKSMEFLLDKENQEKVLVRKIDFS